MARRDLSTPLAASKFDQNDPKKKKKRMTRKQVKAEQAKPVPKKMTPKKPDASKVLDSQIKHEDSVKRMKDKGRSGYRNVSKANLAKKFRK